MKWKCNVLVRNAPCTAECGVEALCFYCVVYILLRCPCDCLSPTYAMPSYAFLLSMVSLLHLLLSTLTPASSLKLTRSFSRSQLRMSSEFMATMSEAISQATGKPFKGDRLEGSYGGGGSGAASGFIVDSQSKLQYFYKSSGIRNYDMLAAEFQGIRSPLITLL